MLQQEAPKMAAGPDGQTQTMAAERVDGLRQMIHEQVTRSDIHAKVPVETFEPFFHLMHSNLHYAYYMLTFFLALQIRGCITDMIASGGADMSEHEIRKGVVHLGLPMRDSPSKCASHPEIWRFQYHGNTRAPQHCARKVWWTTF